MSKWKDIWWHTNKGETIIEITNDYRSKFDNGKKFKEYRYDRVWVANMDYWPIKYFPQAKNLDTYDKSYRLPTPAKFLFLEAELLLNVKENYRCMAES